MEGLGLAGWFTAPEVEVPPTSCMVVHASRPKVCFAVRPTSYPKVLDNKAAIFVL